RLRILGAARAVYVLKGRRGTTTRAIAEQAGVNETTLFRHFGTKQALIDAMREHCAAMPLLRATLEERVAEPIDQALHAIGMQIHEQIDRDRDLICMALAEAQLDPEGSEITWRIPRGKMELLTEFFERRIAGGELRGEPKGIASVFMGAIFAHTMGQKVFKKSSTPTEEFMTSFIAYLLDGVRAR
ncbi:MAG: TetR/AcrR family transcriptional regulator, partial [Vulcanimicrobiaceae bacterium]